METYLPEILKYGGSIAVIYLLILFVNALSKMLQSRTANGQGKDIVELKKKVNNEFSHELQDIRMDINRLQLIISQQGERISWIEAKIGK